MEDLRISIDELMVLKALLRNYAPDFEIKDNNDMKQVKKKIKKVAKHLVPIFKELNLCGDVSINLSNLSSNGGERMSPEDSYTESASKSSPKESSDKDSSRRILIKSEMELLDVLKQDYVLVASNSIRDKVKKIGIEPYKVISAGGPISTEDLKILNPKIPDRALEGYQKKIDALVKKIKDILEKGEKMFFAMGMNEETDQMIDKRMPDLEKMLGAKIQKIIILDWDNL